MKAQLLVLACASVPLLGYSQLFSDDFESYTVGAFLGSSSSTWTTWSGSGGGADDVKIVDDTASNGANSIYFESIGSGGGPDDVVLPFGNKYTNGLFTYSMMMFVANNAGAYFNFQAEQSVGSVWSMDCYLNQDGDVLIQGSGQSLLTGNFPVGQWFELGMSINLNQNEWELFIDSVSQGTFSNPINELASIDIFAYNDQNGGNGVSKFWVDEVMFDHETITIPTVNASVITISPITGLTGQHKTPTIGVRNLGTTAITSFDLAMAYNGQTFNKSVTGIALASYEVHEVELSEGITLGNTVQNFTATVSKVNGGGADDNPNDDSKSISVDPIVPAPDKMVFVEEGTGTWCGWCPRGTVAMAYMQETYPDYFVGVAVHNGDPMTVVDYDTNLGKIMSGYPSAVVDRGADIDPSVMEIDFLERIVLPPAAKIHVNARFTDSSTIVAIINVELKQAIDNNWKVAAVLIEDDMHGKSSDWAQTNYYAGGSNGELIGAGKEWHNEPDKVPADEMKYDHVARDISPSFYGLDNSFPSSTTVGDTFSFNIQFDSVVSYHNLHVAAILIDDAGRIDNANKSNVDTAALGIKGSIVANQGGLSLYPNPMSGSIIYAFAPANIGSVEFNIIDLCGRTVLSNQVQATNNDLYTLNVGSLSPGVYIMNAVVDGELRSAKFIKE
ncbi:MAG: T9SS type A sorting domain-containing protein [Flavobacteriales bacterium]